MPMQLDFGFAAPNFAATRRLFIGIVPDAAAQSAIAASRLHWRWNPCTRFTPSGRFHFTLLFDDACTECDEAAFRRVLASLARSDLPPIELALRPAPVWRNHVAVMVPGENGALSRLRDAIARSYAGPGCAAPYPGTARWTPHLTLAHDADGSTPPAAARAIECRISEVVLVWSQLPPAFPRARHVVLERVSLAGRS